MSDAWQHKQDKIRQLLEMQRRFIAYDREHGVDMQDYFAPDEAHPLHGFRAQFQELALDIVEQAHTAKGSKGG